MTNWKEDFRSESIKRRKRHAIRTAAGFTAVLILSLGAGAIITNTASGSRWLKSVRSDFTGGLERMVTVYDGNGQVIESWSGKIDVQENDYGNKVLFDLNGKRKAVYNAVVIVEEK